jgi:hypothetical protein
MSFTFAEPRTEQLIRLLQRYPNGATLREIAAGLAPIPPKRTLQYWLSKLVFAGQIKRHGGSKNARYFAGSGRCHLPVKQRKPKPPPPLPAPKVAPKPPPAPIVDDSNLPPEYRPLFDKAAPKIIRMGYTDDVAIDELAHVFVAAFRNADTDSMNDFVALAMTELDSLDRDRTLAKYALKRDAWDDWRPAWCRLRDLPEEE